MLTETLRAAEKHKRSKGGGNGGEMLNIHVQNYMGLSRVEVVKKRIRINENWKCKQPTWKVTFLLEVCLLEYLRHWPSTYSKSRTDVSGIGESCNASSQKADTMGGIT